MALTKGKTFTDNEQVTAAKLHQLVDDATIDAGAIDATALASGAVTNAKIAAAAGVALSKISVTIDRLVGGSATNTGEEVTVGAGLDITSSTLTVDDDGITTAKILDANVTAAKLASTLDLSSKAVILADDSIAASKLETDFIDAVSGVAIDAADYLIFSDSSNSNLTRKAQVSTIGSSVAGSIALTAATAAGAITAWPHSLGVAPPNVRLTYFCTAADGGYAVGDEVLAYAPYATSGVPRPAPYSTAQSTGSITLIGASGADPVITNKTDGSSHTMTESKWSIKAYY